MAKAKILLVDDESDIREFLSYSLVRDGYEVFTAINGQDAINKLNVNPDLIIMDIMMPVMDGYQACLHIRSFNKFKDIPIIFLTAKTSELDEIHGLVLGANDFIQKPASIEKILARIQSNLRRGTSTNSNQFTEKTIRVGSFYIDKEKFQAQIDGIDLSLSKKEFEILFLLVSSPGKVFERRKILNTVWGEDIFVLERTIDVHLLSIRRKLGAYSNLLETIKGVGYRFKEFQSSKTKNSSSKKQKTSRIKK